VQEIDFVLERQADVFDMAAQDDFFNARSDRGDTPYSFRAPAPPKSRSDGAGLYPLLPS